MMTGRFAVLAAPVLLTACGGLGGAGPQAGFTAPPPPGAAMVAAAGGDPLLAPPLQPMTPAPTAGAIFQAGSG